MGLLKALPAGLENLAGECEGWAREVAAASTTSAAASVTGQASAAAVAAIHTRVGLSGETFSARLNSTAAAFTATAAGFSEQDAQSAAALTGVSLVI